MTHRLTEASTVGSEETDRSSPVGLNSTPLTSNGRVAHDNPWLAVDAATAPMERARELGRAWENFLGDGDVEAVRVPIAHSWRRSYAAGVDPLADHVAPTFADADQTSALWDTHPLAAAAPVVRSCLGPVADGADELIVLTDADGLLLWIDGPARVRGDAADAINFTEGAGWGERDAGTNAIGTALAADHAVQVFAAEHFNKGVQAWTCSAAPVHDPDTDALLGVIDLTGRMRSVHPHSLACALATAHAVESHLRCLMQDRDAQLRSRYEERLAGRGRRVLVTPSGRVIAGGADGWTGAERLVLPAGGGEVTLPSGVAAFAEPVGHEDALVVRALDARRETQRRPVLRLRILGRDHADVTVDGQTVHLSRRHTEILALLSARPEGMTTEELAANLYGDAGQPGTVRVQVHRLRKLLGPWIDTEPYRLSMDVESDVGRVQGLLDRGAVREAADRYTGPFLPHSEAPGVVRERDALDRWIRHAVLTADDDDALWAWLQSPSGQEDAPAWKRLLGRLDHADPRRSLAAARVGALRASYG
jgi:hypothetical protein